ncbi:hypothetical protein WN943_023846 [Citrus x changshan-huyou]
MKLRRGIDAADAEQLFEAFENNALSTRILSKPKERPDFATHVSYAENSKALLLITRGMN